MTWRKEKHVPNLRKVAFVDDSHNFLESMKGWQAAVGMEEMTTAEPQTVLEWVRSGRVDVVVSDLKMPSVDGVTLLEMAHEIAPTIQCVLLTGYRPSEGETKRLRAIGCDIVQKPTEIQRLMRKLAGETPNSSVASQDATIAALRTRVEALEQM